MKLIIRSLIPVTLLLSAPAVTLADITVFSDTFGNGSTVQSASPAAPTANSTAYEWFQGASAPSGITIAPGDLHLAERSTTSEVGEVQALFTTTPVTLSSLGDWIDLTLTFTDTAGILVAGTGSTSSSSLNVGLFNSGGVSPNQGARLNNGSLSGGSQGWNGYGAKFFGNVASTPQIFQRLPQTPNGTTSQNQDLVFGSQSGTAGFNNPAANVVGTGSSTSVALTAGSVYTLDFRITVSAANTLTISNAIYSGSSVAGVPVFAQIGSTNSVSPGDLNYTFDGMAFGWREVFGANASSAADVSSITVTRNDVVLAPEPGTLALAGLGCAALLVFRRRR